MIFGELGNLAAYADPNTPAAVVTAVGCVGVIASWFISTIFLKEPFRWRDVGGGLLVMMGVSLIVAFAPRAPAVLSSARLRYLLVQPGAIIIYVVYLAAIGALFVVSPKLGHTHVAWYLSQSAFIAAFTVMTAKPVSTFAIKAIGGLFNSKFTDFVSVDDPNPNPKSNLCPKTNFTLNDFVNAERLELHLALSPLIAQRLTDRHHPPAGRPGPRRRRCVRR